MEYIKLSVKEVKAINVIKEQIFNTDLRKLTSQELEKCILGFYEVEPEFKVGDFVVAVITDHACIGEIKRINESGSAECQQWVRLKDNLKIGYGGMPLSKIRHATPEEIKQEKDRRWWEKHGRKLWELREGDLLKNKANKLSYEVSKVSDDNSCVAFTKDVGFRGKAMIRENYKVMVFAESRLDRGDE